MAHGEAEMKPACEVSYKVPVGVVGEERGEGRGVNGGHHCR